MKIHVTESKGRQLFWAESSFAEKDLLKDAGFLWHGGDRCHPGCSACAAGIGKVWWTLHSEAAAKLGEYTDPEARAALGISVELAQIGCANLHLAMLASLVHEKIIPPLEIAKLLGKRGSDDHDSDDGDFDEDDFDDGDFDEDLDDLEESRFNYELAEALAERDITTAQLGRLHELCWPQQTADDDVFIEEALCPEWDGEDEYFNITSLDGIKHCVALELLELARLDVKTLAPISTLGTLRRLALDFRDKPPPLAPIAELTALEDLELSWVKSLSPLKGMPGLKKLHVGQSKVTDLSPLTELPALETVEMWWSLQPAEIEQVRAKNTEVLTQLEQRGIELKLSWPEPKRPAKQRARKRT